MFDEFKKYIGPLLVTVVSLFPVALWIVARPLEERFGALDLTLFSFGQVAGLVGMALFSAALVLSARLKIITNYFDSLNKEYSTHHTVGVIAFALIMFHPLLLSFQYLNVSVEAMARFLLPRSDWSINLGLIALPGLVILIVITLFAKFKYHILLAFHKFLGAIFILASIHMLISPGELRQNAPLALYMSIVMSIGIAAFFYRTLLGRFIVDRLSYRVESAREVGEKVVEIELAPVSRELKFRPGQFVFVNFKSNTVSGEVHPFSFSGGTNEPNLKITVKSLGDYTNKLLELEKNAPAYVEGPFGRFFYEYQSGRDKIWIAGGIGITPFLSMIRTLTSGAENPGFRIFFFYSVKTKSEFVFLDELTSIAKAFPWFNFIPFCADQSGFLKVDFIDKITHGVRNKDIYICGPMPMMKALQSDFIKLGVIKRRIHLEQFRLL